MLQRYEIEGRDAYQIAELLKAAFEKHCVPAQAGNELATGFDHTTVKSTKGATGRPFRDAGHPVAPFGWCRG
jgi:hypothetical protein